MLGFKHSHKSSAATCSHPKALPRWDRVEDAGNLERVSQWYCPACDRFIPADVYSPPERPSVA